MAGQDHDTNFDWLKESEKHEAAGRTPPKAFPAARGDESSLADEPTQVIRGRSKPEATFLVSPHPSRPESSVDSPPSQATIQPNNTSSASPANPSMTVIALAAYASFVTLALVLVLLSSWGSPSHHLESLPDIEPESENSLTYVPVHATVPSGHALSLGNKARFGNILVQPLKVTFEPVSFTHYDAASTATRPDTKPVWKLWIRLTNVSKDQSIAPLDRRLVLRSVHSPQHGRSLSNYYVSQQKARSSSVPLVEQFPLPPNGDWDLTGQSLGRVLKPGESYETYLATSEEGLDSLPDQLAWRFQLRKGYSPNGNGVTTIVEVDFDRSQIQMASR